MLLTRTPLYSSLRTFSFDLHVLGTPPALILSQDQTLNLNLAGIETPCGVHDTVSLELLL